MEAFGKLFFALCLVGTQISGILAFVSFDRFVKTFYESRQDLWQEKKSPPGFFWRPPGGTNLRGHQTRQEFLWEVSFSTPSWVSECPTLLAALRTYHRCYWAGLVLGTLTVILAVMLFR
jgi:hypothetical protein